MTDLEWQRADNAGNLKPALWRAIGRYIQDIRKLPVSAGVLGHMRIARHVMGTCNGLDLMIVSPRMAARADEIAPVLCCGGCAGRDFDIPLLPAAAVVCKGCGKPHASRENVEIAAAWLHVELARQHGGHLWKQWLEAKNEMVGI